MTREEASNWINAAADALDLGPWVEVGRQLAYFVVRGGPDSLVEAAKLAASRRYGAPGCDRPTLNTNIRRLCLFARQIARIVKH